jgi:hypothetical protein
LSKSHVADLTTMEVQARPILPTTEVDVNGTDMQPRVYKRRWMIENIHIWQRHGDLSCPKAMWLEIWVVCRLTYKS